MDSQRKQVIDAFNVLVQQYPSAAITAAVQALPGHDFQMQVDKHLSRNALGGAIGVIATPSHKIILTKRSGMHAGWALPGGTVEQGEDFKSAFEREILEEAGVTLDNVQLSQIEQKQFVAPDGETLFFLLAVFSADTDLSILPPRTKGAKAEGLDVALFSYEDLPSKMIFSDRQKINFLLKKIGEDQNDSRL